MSILQSGASEWIHGIKVSFTIVCPTKPTPLVTTDGAGHMITARNFLYDRTTLFAFLNFLRILPLFYLVFKYRITAFAFMTLTMTFRTYIKITFRTIKVFLFLLNRYDDWTFWIGTPHKVRIFLNFCIFHKLFINRVNFLIYILFDSFRS